MLLELRRLTTTLITLLLVFACQELRPKVTNTSRQAANQGSAGGSAGMGSGSGELEDTVASEPAVVAGSYLIEPGQVQPTMSTNSTDMRGSPGSVKSQGDTSDMERSIELVAFDIATNAVQITATTLEFNIRVVAKAAIEADGSFRIQGTFKVGEILFLRAPARGNAKVLVDSSKINFGLVWLDPNGFVLRRIDQLVADSIRVLLEPANVLLVAEDRLRLTNECRGCYLAGADFSNRNIANADLTDAVLTGAKFNQSNAQYVKFIRADLRSADFSNANVAFSDFLSAKLQGILTQGMAAAAAINLQL